MIIISLSTPVFPSLGKLPQYLSCVVNYKICLHCTRSLDYLAVEDHHVNNETRKLALKYYASHKARQMYYNILYIMAICVLYWVIIRQQRWEICILKSVKVKARDARDTELKSKLVQFKSSQNKNTPKFRCTINLNCNWVKEKKQESNLNADQQRWSWCNSINSFTKDATKQRFTGDWGWWNHSKESIRQRKSNKKGTEFKYPKKTKKTSKVQQKNKAKVQTHMISRETLKNRGRTCKDCGEHTDLNTLRMEN